MVRSHAFVVAFRKPLSLAENPGDQETKHCLEYFALKRLSFHLLHRNVLKIRDECQAFFTIAGTIQFPVWTELVYCEQVMIEFAIQKPTIPFSRDCAGKNDTLTVGGV